jgi:hypothetical protein
VASPFAIFRRNQKIMLAVVGIGAMIAFVFLDPVTRYMSGTRAPENPVVVETKYGALKESDLANLRATRELVEIFLKRASAETVTAQIKNGAMDPRTGEQMLDRWYSTWRDNLMARSTAAPEEAAVETYVLARKAQQLGIIVSDRAINDFLKQLTADSLTSDVLQDIINSLHAGRRVSPARLFDAIRTEMMASKCAELFVQSLRDIPPAQKFEYYCRLNRRAKVELVPLAVSDFVGQVPDPTDEELKTFFDKYKGRYANPASPEPGFKEPKRAAFQYFKADFAKFKEKAAPDVTDAEIAEYYEKNKEQFRAIELSPDKQPDVGDAQEKPSGDDAPDRSSSDETPEGKPDETTPPKTEGASDAPSADKPADDHPAAEKPAAEKAAGEKPDQSWRRHRAAIRLVSATTDEAKSAAAASPAPDDKPLGDEAKPAEPASEAADEPAADAKPAEAAGESKSDEEAALAKPEPPKYEPLEKVRDQIRDSLAGQKASKVIGEIFDELSAEMRRYADDVDTYNARKGSKSNLTPPKPFPFAELAKKKGVEAKELPLVTAAEAEGEDIGQVRKIVQDRRSQFGFRAEPFAQFAFLDSFPTYKTDLVQDNTTGDVYLFWKTEEKATYVPTLEEARDKVVKAWKLVKARDIARKRAQEYATQARVAKLPFKEAFANQPDLKVSETDWFSWMTLGNVPFDPSGGQPRLSEVEGVEYPGASFMREIFSLAGGGIGVTSNEPENTFYVVRLADYEKPLDELRNDFAGERQPIYLTVARPDQRRIYEGWLADVEKDAGVKWIRPADSSRLREAADFQGDVDMDF